MSIRLIHGDCRSVLPILPAASVQCVVTSPPYFGLRDYGTALWDGGEPACDHLRPAAHGYEPFATSTLGPKRDGCSPDNSAHSDAVKRQQFRDVCGKCGARRIDAQIGLEPTPDAYVAGLVAVFRQVRHVLRDDGICWVNLGDSYAGYWGEKYAHKPFGPDRTPDSSTPPHKPSPDFKAWGIKPKDLLMIPARAALALQADGWWLRGDIIWAKPNGMPGSQTDRPTSSHEHIFLLSKSEDYWSDFDAIKTPPRESTRIRLTQDIQSQAGSHRANGGAKTNGPMKAVGNADLPAMMRDVWFVPPKGYDEGHFAVMPEEIARRCILAGCPSGGTVLDPFSGVGTTALVADRFGRHAIGIDLNQQYSEMACRRIEQAQRQSDLFLDPTELRTLAHNLGSEPSTDPKMADLFGKSRS